MLAVCRCFVHLFLGGKKMKDKSVALALALTLFLGPLGLFYASAWGAVTLIVVAAAGVVPTMGFVLIFVWPASMAWAAIAASRKHSEFVHELDVSAS
jgi:hypothetical protein